MLQTLKNIATGGVQPSAPALDPPAPLPSSKIGLLMAMLERTEGATLTDLAEATGWLPHTTRAALTRLRQKGHRIDKASLDGVSVYTIVKAV